MECPSHLVLLAKMDDETAASEPAGFAVKFKSIAEPMRHSLTYGQGNESTRQLCEQTGVNIYFCDQHSPWQCGTCENTDCLLRK